MMYLKQVTQTQVTLVNQPGKTAELKRQIVKHLIEINGTSPPPPLYYVQIAELAGTTSLKA